MKIRIALLFIVVLLSTLNIHANAALKPDQAIRIDKIEITGTWKTVDSLILNELLFTEGDTVTLDIIEASIVRVMNRRYFFDEKWEIKNEDGINTFILDLRERWTTIPVIYVIGDDNKTRFNAGVIESNLLGYGIFLRANYTGEFFYDSDARHNFAFNYVQPDILPSTELRLKGGYNSYYSEIGGADYALLDAFAFDSGFGEIGIAYEFYTDWYVIGTSGYSRDSHSNAIPLENGYQGSTFTASIPYFGMAIELNTINHVSQRLDGLKLHLESEVFLPDSIDSFAMSFVEFQYHKLLFDDFVYILSRFKTSYSPSSETAYQAPLGEMLRGGSAGTYYASFISGVNIEAGIAPVQEDWLFLETVFFIDAAVHGDLPGDAFSSTPKVRYGPGIRISFPPIAGLYICVDYAIAETAEATGIYFGMLKYIKDH